MIISIGCQDVWRQRNVLKRKPQVWGFQSVQIAEVHRLFVLSTRRAFCEIGYLTLWFTTERLYWDPNHFQLSRQSQHPLYSRWYLPRISCECSPFIKLLRISPPFWCRFAVEVYKSWWLRTNSAIPFLHLTALNHNSCWKPWQGRPTTWGHLVMSYMSFPLNNSRRSAWFFYVFLCLGLLFGWRKDAYIQGFGGKYSRLMPFFL